MKTEKRKKLEKAGWRVGNAGDFLALSPAEKAYVEMKLALAQELAEARRAKRLTQQTLAAKLRTSQPRVAMMEKGDPSVSLDLLVRALLILGVTPHALSLAVAAGRPLLREATATPMKESGQAGALARQFGRRAASATG